MELTKVVPKLTKKDADICRAFRNVVRKGKFEVQGEALTQVGAFFTWLDALEVRILETIKEPEVTIRKEVGHVEVETANG